MTKMSQSAVKYGVPSKIFEIKSSCEKFLNDTQIELKIFKIEQNSFRDHLIEIAEENERLKKQLHAIQSTNSLFESARDDMTVKEYSADIIEMLQDEILSYKAENDELKKIQDHLRKTIENHQKEIESYRDFVFGKESKANLPNTVQNVQELKDLVAEKDAELNERALYIETLENQKKMLLDEIELLQKQLKVAQLNSNQLDAFEKTQRIILAANHEKVSLQKSLQQATLVIAEHMEKERIALQKMGEALGIAETAFYEKEEILKNKLILEKEREFLAATIGQVMEEASQKVDSRMQKMRQKLKEYEQKLKTLTEVHKNDIANQQKAYNCLETLLKVAQDQNKELLQENDKLKKEREVMRKALDQIGIKMQSNGNLLYDDNEDKKMIEKLKSEIQHINQKCKFTVDDITQEFQKTTKRLSNENAELKAQLKLLQRTNANEFCR